MTGRLIALEGGEACGKSTQASRLAERLGAVLTREPGGTGLGRRLRELVLDQRDLAIDERAEALLMIADRAQHVAETIRPALERGQHVVTDRFTGSTLAYQGYGRGLDVDELRRMSAWATGGIDAHLVLLLRVPVEEQRRRMSGARDRLEDAGPLFHSRVAAGFDALAAADPERWIVIDGMGSIDEVADRVWEAVAARAIMPA